MKPHKLPVKYFDNKREESKNYYEQEISITDIEDTVDDHGRLLNQKPAYEKLIHNQVQLQLGDKVQKDKVIQRYLGPDGVNVGTYNDNLSLNSILYYVELPDGTIREYAANVIAESKYTRTKRTWIHYNTCSIPRRAVRSHSLVCSEQPVLGWNTSYSESKSSWFWYIYFQQ